MMNVNSFTSTGLSSNSDLFLATATGQRPRLRPDMIVLPTLRQLLELAHCGRDSPANICCVPRKLGAPRLLAPVLCTPLDIAEESLRARLCGLFPLGGSDDVTELRRAVIDRDGHGGGFVNEL
jgi:hypothetical protein